MAVNSQPAVELQVAPRNTPQSLAAISRPEVLPRYAVRAEYAPQSPLRAELKSFASHRTKTTRKKRVGAMNV
eukprot:scaffold422111_cov27-Prasinocladus_malaysianus.AAC.1